MAATLPLREALNKGIVSGTFVDTKIILFSRRVSSGRVCGSRALYASSHVLKSVPYFNDLLFGNFSEAELRDFNEDTDGRESTAEDYGYYSDSDLEDDEDEEPTPPTLTHGGSAAGPSGPPHSQGGEESYYETHTELPDKGKVIRVPDMAFVTFQAFILYLYTGKIAFASLGSQENHNSGASEVRTSSANAIPRASPKSVYRLADKYDVPELKVLAFNSIRTELKNRDIVEETFSEFTSRYDDVKMECVTQLVSALRNDTAEKATWAKFCEIIDNRYKEDLGCVQGTLSLLWRIINQSTDTSTTTTSNSLPPSTSIDSPTKWDALQEAIVKSIREGVFFDRKCWVRCSKSRDVLKALYFSSTIVGDKLGVCG
ncbi:hypothetical protein BJ322DRAFT_1092680 [Thelephora terrestris]|uniref:BTB domain-containing protein n=1 Tax=Thelephora terrestris TaxID=56493 RepID=A0A9P6H3C5_9AGAM|nr:hypothetical protein BJ322DRAFT_1092680 [Thelephora terrestris]